MGYQVSIKSEDMNFDEPYSLINDKHVSTLLKSNRSDNYETSYAIVVDK